MSLLLTFSATSPADLEIAINNALAPMLAFRFTAVDFVFSDAQRLSGAELVVTLNREASATPSATPFRVKILTARTPAELNTDYNNFVSGLPAGFVAPPVTARTADARRIDPFVSIVFYNATAAASGNWGPLATVPPGVYLQSANNLSDVASAALSRANLGVDKRTAVGNTNYVILPTDKEVATSVALTAPRTWTLPAANSVNAGQEIIVSDEFGAVNGVNVLIVARAGADTINGGTSETIGAQYGMRRFFSNGTNAWTFDKGVLRASNNLSDVASRTLSALALGVLLSSATETRAADFTVDVAKPGAVYNVTAGAAGVAVTLPSAATAGDGFPIIVKKSDISAGDVSITGGYRLTGADDSITLRSNGTVWEIINRYYPLTVEVIGGIVGTFGDGDVTISAGTTTLVRDMHYRRLTISGAATQLNPAGYAVQGDVMDAAGASAASFFGYNPSVGGNAAGATAGVSSTTNAGNTLFGGLAGNSGGTGVVGVGALPTNISAAAWLAGRANAGGSGGTGGSGAGGASRAAASSSITRFFRSPSWALTLGRLNVLPVAAGAPGQAGSSGAGDGANTGGGGGGSGKGGNQLWLCFRKIVVSATTPASFIQARGSAGGNGGNTGAGNTGGGGGGAGGSGGYVFLGYGELVGAATIGVDVTAGNGGNGGNGTGTGATGSGGSSGSPGYVARLNLRTGAWTDFGTPGDTAFVANVGATGGVATSTVFGL